MHFWEILIREHQILIYAAVFLGMFIEPDITFLLSSIFASEGYLSWVQLTAISFVGVMMSDLAWYFLGKLSDETTFGHWVRNRFKTYEAWIGENIHERYGRVVFFSRYIYVISRLMPFLAGWEKMNIKKFLKYHFLSNIVWLFVLTLLGHSLGIAVAIIGPRLVVRRIEYVFIGLAIVFIGGELIIKKIFTKKAKNPQI